MWCDVVLIRWCVSGLIALRLCFVVFGVFVGFVTLLVWIVLGLVLKFE